MNVKHGFQEANKVFTETGAILPKPTRIRFAFIKVLAVILPGLYIGAHTAKTMAIYLEENDLFVPTDDD